MIGSWEPKIIAMQERLQALGFSLVSQALVSCGMRPQPEAQSLKPLA